MKSIAALCLLLAGCGTIQDLSNDLYTKGYSGNRPAPRVFGGVRMDVIMANEGHISLGWLHYLDLPFSLPLDVLLLPFSTPIALFASPDDNQEIPK